MIATKYPNQDALYAAYTIYRDAMRLFIIESLKKNCNTPIEQLISEALNKLPRNQEYPVKIRNENEAITTIDINDFPYIIETYWQSPGCFSERFNADRTIWNEIKRIKDGRLHWAHPGLEDTDRSVTLKLLWLIAEILGKINDLDAKSEVEAISNQLCPNESETRLAVMSNRLETTQAEAIVLKKQLVATEERLAVAVAEKTAAEEQLADISAIVTAESFWESNNRKTTDAIDEQSDSETTQMHAEVRSTLEVGQWVNGRVKSLAAFGAFVDLDGINGLIHISELTHKRINDPEDVVSIGEEVKVKIVNIDQKREEGKTRIDLRLKPEPWEDNDVEKDYPIDKVVQGTVNNIEPFGVFLKLEEGLRGMIHKSELSWKPNDMTPSDFNENQKLKAKVINISKEEKRISLSLKQLTPNPWERLKEKYPDGTPITGRVVNITNFGVFVEVKPDFNGLLRVPRPELLDQDQEVRVIISSIDVEKQQISLDFPDKTDASRYI